MDEAFTNDTICIVSPILLGGSVVSLKEYRTRKKSLLKPIDPVLKDKLFAGWYKDENCSELWDFDVDVVTEDITLYAKWKDIENSVIEEEKYLFIFRVGKLLCWR